MCIYKKMPLKKNRQIREKKHQIFTQLSNLFSYERSDMIALSLSLQYLFGLEEENAKTYEKLARTVRENASLC